MRAEAAYVGTGIEARAAVDAADVILAKEAGVVTRVSSQSIRVEYNKLGSVEHDLLKIKRSNQDTCINKRPIVAEGH